jgi:hypothetical protein
MKFHLLAAAALALLTLGGCTKPDATTKILAAQGFTQIVIEGYAFLGCSEDDTHRTRFRAVSASGEIVRGVACSGFWKGTTLRFTDPN